MSPFVIDNVPGDVPANGRLVLTDIGGRDVWRVDVGWQSRHFDLAPTAALFYEAEALTPLGASTKTAQAGASGSGSNTVLLQNVGPTWRAMLKSEIDATNAALTHKGSFRVKVRVFRGATTGGVTKSMRLEWAEGDYRTATLNDPVSWGDEAGNTFAWVDLGPVHISPGSDRWEFRILVKCEPVSIGNFWVDCVALLPTTEGYIELSARQQFETPSVFVARDEFDQPAGALTGEPAPVGGAWSGAGDADDFENSGSPFFRVVRNAFGDADYNTGRYGRLGTGTLAAVAVQATMGRTGGPEEGDVLLGVFARYVDADNWLMAQIYPRFSPSYPGMARIVKRVGGTVKMLAGVGDSGLGMLPPDTTTTQGPLPMPLAPNAFYTVRLTADTAGRVYMAVGPDGAVWPGIELAAYDPDLAAGGPLDDGGYGIYDACPNAIGGWTRMFDNFSVFVPTTDAAIFAGRSLELRHDGAVRQSADGLTWPRVSIRRGRYLKVPPSGRERRSTRFIVLPYENDPETMGDPAVPANLQAEVFVTPRGLVVPES